MDDVHQTMSSEPEITASPRLGASVDKLRSASPASPELKIDSALERRVVRKIDLHLIPLVMSLYLVAFLDRSNIGNAQTAGMVTVPLLHYYAVALKDYTNACFGTRAKI
ncbi:hypothetical protein F4680DRAFT_69908 [Xylaria scruposa]|nr:hypothetical protein F4680DRAFT_69908 [Xylaria scruposa]